MAEYAQLEIAQKFVDAGFSVIPVWLRSKQPRIKWSKYQASLPTEYDLHRWFSQPTNAAIVTGMNGLVVLDFDDLNEYLSWLVWCFQQGSVAAYIASNAYRVRTRRGMHVYLRCSQKIKNKHFGPIDVKAWGGLVMMTGSIHPTGYQYQAVKENLVIPLFTELQDILSPEILARHAEIDDQIQPATYDPNLSPWDALDQKSASIDQIKQSWKIEEFFPDVIKSGDHWALTKCPFHKDENPSFWLDYRNQLCGCYSGCTDKPLDVINLYSRLHHCSLQSAVQEMSMRIVL